jgi:Tol biopolymer transport system component
MLRWTARSLLGTGLLVFLFAPSVPAGQDARKVTPTNLACNTDADEDDPAVSSDGKTLYYSVKVKGRWQFMASRRNLTTQPWKAGEPLDDPINSTVDDRGITLTPEGRYPQYAYFATKKDDLKGANFDLYVAVKQGPGKVFSSATPVNAADTPDDEMHPWLTGDGKQLYFSRKTREGWRVFVTGRRDPASAQGFGDPVLVKDLPPDFHHVTLTPDGKIMYLQGPLEKDRVGLFLSKNMGTGWSKPQELTVLNSAEAPRGDRSPCLSRDGKLLYFVSDRPGGKGGQDIWVVPTQQILDAMK